MKETEIMPFSHFIILPCKNCSSLIPDFLLCSLWQCSFLTLVMPGSKREGSDFDSLTFSVPSQDPFPLCLPSNSLQVASYRWSFPHQASGWEDRTLWLSVPYSDHKTSCTDVCNQQTRRLCSLSHVIGFLIQIKTTIRDRSKLNGSEHSVFLKVLFSCT